MAAIVRAGDFPQGGAVVLTTFDGYWDALSAAGLAGLVQAPVLMTHGNALSTQTADLLAKLAPKTIVVCGGVDAVSDGVASAAASAAGNARLIRRAGQTATDTACAVFESDIPDARGRWASDAFVCTNEGYWDALAAAPLSSSLHMPIFMTEGASDISNATLECMVEGGVERAYIVGGREAVSETVADKLAAAGIVVADRLWGQEACETSAKVAEFGVSQGLLADGLGVATTNGYWDALAGASFCGMRDSVAVLVDGPQAASIPGFVAQHADDIADVYVFGGASAVSEQTRATIASAAR